tara:strand:+ start:496 stop:915 length:420 start_codon:yes stop_codon:yes gene_type:complete
MGKFATILLCSIFISSCLYENGPAFSFRLKSERISNVWVYENYLINNLDVTSLFDSSRLEFTRDGYVYKQTTHQDSLITNIGKWEFDETTRSILKIYLIDSTLSTWGESWTILRLKEDDMWLESRSGVEIHELRLRPAP